MTDIASSSPAFEVVANLLTLAADPQRTANQLVQINGALADLEAAQKQLAADKTAAKADLA